MGNINLFIFNGTMMSGKTTLINKIIEQNKNSENIVFLGEKNYYGFKKDFLEKEKPKNFQFQIQIFLLKNFVNKLRKEIREFISSEGKKSLDIFCDTYPPSMGIIFTKYKLIAKLITYEECEFLFNEYNKATKILEDLFWELRELETVLNVYHFYRVIDYKLSFSLLRQRSREEANFYIKNLDYYKNIYRDLSDTNILPLKIKRFFELYSDNIKFYIQRINRLEDFEKFNNDIFNIVYEDHPT